MGVNIFLEICCAAALCKAVGVLIIGQEQHLYVHALGQQHVNTAQRCLDARLVTVIEYGYVVGETVYQTNLPRRERCAA